MTAEVQDAMKSSKQTYAFQTEVRQLLKLMIHSLYSNREIFLRELISNASDANDRLRFQALAKPELLGEDRELKIWIDCDAAASTITVRDNGIGMTQEETIEHLGTIAKSGTADFLQSLTGNQQKDSDLIGQFGVGFYSAFIVADRVEVHTRKAGSDETGVHWESTADGEFSVEPLEYPHRGTTVTLHLKSDAKEFSEPYRLRALIRRYSDHIGFPVLMRKPGGENATPDYEGVNHAQALWMRPRADITDEEYRQFYRHISHDSSDPLTWSHHKVEGKREYVSLLYIPERAPYDLMHRDGVRGLKLYIKRVFIMDDAEQFLPLYLRFVKGIIDSSDLSLNVSRELLQKGADTEAIRAGLTKRVLDMLENMASDEPDKYRTFWKAFGVLLKEGIAQDFANRDKLIRLLRFCSTQTSDDEGTVSLRDYVDRMKPGQDKIYYLIAESLAAARVSPYIETLKERGIEVLLLSERIDEWMAEQLDTFDGKLFQNVTRGDLDLKSTEDTDDGQSEPDAAESPSLLKRFKDLLGDRVEDVRAGTRLRESPACLVLNDQGPSSGMRRILSSAGHKLYGGKPTLELNMNHRLVRYLDSTSDADVFAELAQLLFDQAALVDGEKLGNPIDFVQRLNRFLVRMTELGTDYQPVSGKPNHLLDGSHAI